MYSDVVEACDVCEFWVRCHGQYIVVYFRSRSLVYSAESA